MDFSKRRFALGNASANTKSKYHSRKQTIDGHVFASKREAARYAELKLLERAGIISDLELQKRFELIPSQRIDGKVVERPCYYVCDFAYCEGGKQVIEDAKGMKTEVYKIKKKLMLYKYGIRVREV